MIKNVNGETNTIASSDAQQLLPSLPKPTLLEISILIAFPSETFIHCNDNDNLIDANKGEENCHMLKIDRR